MLTAEYCEHDVTSPPSPFTEPLTDIRPVARFLGYTENGLAALIRRGNGPPHLRIGRLIRFSPAAVKAWAQGQIEINNSPTA
jgi:predicted DNA-binding transcriptional regulator AlpA